MTRINYEHDNRPSNGSFGGAKCLCPKCLEAHKRCRKCGGEMRPGKAIAQTFTGMSDFPGCEVVTMSPGGPGKLIEQSHRVIGRCPSNPREALRLIEYCGRVCYNSEDKIAEDSAEPFVRKLIERGHLSVLEHSEVCFSGIYDEYPQYLTPLYKEACTVGNIRAWIEHLKTVAVFDDWVCGDEHTYPKEVPPHLRRYTVEFTTNRAMTHELVRHRPASFSQESQRYVRYDDMKFIKPVGFEGWNFSARNRFFASCACAENDYRELLHSGGLVPQQARNILPNATATRIIVTADRQEWEHIFKLRCGGGADPQMIDLMVPVRDEMVELWRNEK